MKKLVLAVFLLILACATPLPDEQPDAFPTESRQSEARHWLDVDLADLNSGRTFRLSEFSGTIVLLEQDECPPCVTQKQELENVGITPITITLGSEREEGSSPGYHAQATEEFASLLVQEFGLLSNPSLILLCEGKKARMLPRGMQAGEEIIREIARGC